MLVRVKASFPALGITRLGRLTGLDSVGIPVWMAVRPNSANLSVSQGKGIDDDAAALSAAMEAAELALAERPVADALIAPRAELLHRGFQTFLAERHLRLGSSLPDEHEELPWVEGYDLLSGEAVFVPQQAIRFVDRPDTNYWQSSDGLGAGASLTEAAVHGICELVERDAMAIWSFRTIAEMEAREVRIPPVADDRLEHLVERITAAELRLRLFDITSDLQVPCFLAVVSPLTPSRIEFRHLELSNGTGAHPTAAGAVQRAVLEALQSRLTAIAGARDDIDPEQYQKPPGSELLFYLDEGMGGHADVAIGAEVPGVVTAPAQLDWLLMRLKQARIRSAILVSLNAEAFGFSVGRMLIPDLEQHPATRNRRLGRRALAAMVGQR